MTGPDMSSHHFVLKHERLTPEARSKDRLSHLSHMRRSHVFLALDILAQLAPDVWDASGRQDPVASRWCTLRLRLGPIIVRAAFVQRRVWQLDIRDLEEEYLRRVEFGDAVEQRRDVGRGVAIARCRIEAVCWR